MNEDDYCQIFADALASDPAFRQWVLTRTKFFDRREATLLVEEQSVRPAKHWWRHWWTQLPDGSQSETDVFAVFHDQEDGARFALHLECKVAKGKFMPNQPAQYALRGEHMMSNKWAPYAQFDTILLAPAAFAQAYPTDTHAFGAFISFEDVGRWLPAFRSI